jgi:hypothetical protein
VALAGVPDTSGDAKAVELIANIEADVFSGRPNPAFELRGEEARRLKLLLDRSREVAREYPSPPGLGFRGFVVRFSPPGEADYRIFGDIVMRGSAAFRDPDLEVQNYIVSLLPPKMRAVIGQ